MKQSQSITSLSELDIFASQLVNSLHAQGHALVITLEGDLGAGKTTLSQMIGKHLGVTEPISSPTFVISKYYDLNQQPWKRLIHIDAYRLDGQNLEPLDFPTLFSDPDNIILIEWPVYIQSILPKNPISITISTNKDESRNIEIKYIYCII